MKKGSAFKALASSLMALAILLTSVVLSPAHATPSYPSWAEVEAAKKKVSDKRAMIKKLEDYIAQLEADAEKLGKVALIKGEAFNIAQDAVDAVQVKVDSLQSQVDQATETANQAEDQLGQIASQMYRDGAAGNTLNFFLNSSGADDLLYKLGAQNKLAQQNDTIYQRAVATQRLAQSLSDQLKVAKEDLAAKAAVARSAFSDAQSAADAVDAKVAESNDLNKVFYKQLASLKNTSADLERQRAEGLAAERRQNAGTSVPDAPELYDVGAPDDSKVETMLAFAKAQLGERYILGAMGPDAWDCSGLTKAAYAAAGIYIGTHSASDQFNTMAYRRKLIPIKQAVKGDIMWYSLYSGFSSEKYHVVIYLGGGMMLEAPNPARTVRIVPLRYGELFRYAARPSA